MVGNIERRPTERVRCVGWIMFRKSRPRFLMRSRPSGYEVQRVGSVVIAKFYDRILQL